MESCETTSGQLVPSSAEGLGEDQSGSCLDRLRLTVLCHAGESFSYGEGTQAEEDGLAGVDLVPGHGAHDDPGAYGRTSASVGVLGIGAGELPHDTVSEEFFEKRRWFGL